ncbi:hypothetical protein BJ741DRAFT_292701 [Chytriomyces cf. hyalinus JEL632]|nr:hypothetical protein BJ741DRAFT_292701 [Chytriomyces cf. hyalinus JEL632]
MQMQVAEFHDLTNSLRQSLSQLQGENNGLRSTITQLQTVNAALLAQPWIAGGPPPSQHNCAAEVERTMMLQNKVAELEVKLKEFEKPWGYQQMVSASTLLASFDFVFGAPTTTDSSISFSSTTPDQLRNETPESLNSGLDGRNEDWLEVAAASELKTSEQLFGAIKVEFARYSLQSIASLKGNPLIDQSLDSLISASRTCEKPKLRKHLMRTFIAQAKILSSTTSPDNRKDHCQIHDIFSTLRAFNRQHYDYMMDIIVDQNDLKRLFKEEKPATPETQNLAACLKSIKALASVHDVIDEMCILSDLPKLTPEIMMEMRKRKEILENLCVPGSAEYERLRCAMKKHRPGNKEDMVWTTFCGFLESRLY